MNMHNSYEFNALTILENFKSEYGADDNGYIHRALTRIATSPPSVPGRPSYEARLKKLSPALRTKENVIELGVFLAALGSELDDYRISRGWRLSEEEKKLAAEFITPQTISDFRKFATLVCYHMGEGHNQAQSVNRANTAVLARAEDRRRAANETLRLSRKANAQKRAAFTP
jgi:hypothetical protein